MSKSELEIANNVWPLTEDEMELILELRAEAAAKKNRDLRTVHLLRAASEFESWRQGEGAGGSYSTFCDDFGYPPPGNGFEYLPAEGEDRPLSRGAIYKAVMALIALAKNS